MALQRVNNKPVNICSALFCVVQVLGRNIRGFWWQFVYLMTTDLSHELVTLCARYPNKMYIVFIVNKYMISGQFDTKAGAAFASHPVYSISVSVMQLYRDVQIPAPTCHVIPCISRLSSARLLRCLSVSRSFSPLVSRPTS